MNELVFGFLCLLAVWVLIMMLPSGARRRPGLSWFEILPHLAVSKKARGRQQQTHRHGARRY